MRVVLSSRRGGRALAAISLSLVASAFHADAWADVRIVTEVSVSPAGGVRPTGQENAEAAPRTITTLVKGRMLRRESADGTVYIVDADKNKVHVLNSQGKTYYTLSLKDAMERGSKLEGRMAEMLSLEVKIAMREQKGGETPPSIDGKPVTGYSVDGNASIAFQGPRGGGFPGGGPPGGGFPGGGGPPGGGPPGGGFPGGGFPGGGGGAPGGGGPPGGGRSGAPPEMPRFSLKGDVWASDTAAILGVDPKDAKDLGYAFAQAILPENSPFLKTLCDRVARRLPLAGRLTIQHPGPPPQQNQQPPDPNSGPPPAPQTQSLTITFSTKSIESGVTLEDSLFVIPEGFTQTDAPKAASLIGPGGRGRGPGGGQPLR